MMRDYRPDMEARDARRRKEIRSTALMVAGFLLVMVSIPPEVWPW